MPSQAHSRRDPQQGKKGFSRNKGFTLIELMIAIAVLAIILSLAMPSYHSIIEKRRVTSSTEQVAAFLSAAQMEAVKRNLEVEIACTTTLCTSTVLNDPAVNGADIELSTLDLTRLSADVVNVEFDPNDGRVVFDPVRGMLATVDIGQRPLEIQLESPEQMYAMSIRLAATGRVKMCSGGTRSVPGYDECAILGGE